MPRSFQLKQFAVRDDQCGQKVGTDAILLGSWAGRTMHQPTHVLDVGTGCGIIALMLAQRFTSAQVAAAEIDSAAAVQAQQNFDASGWSHRLKVRQGDVRDVSWSGTFDLVVCNPPFFHAALKPADAARRQARHQDDLSLCALCRAVSKVLSEDGRLAVVIPADSESQMVEAANDFRLKPVRRRLVRPTPRHDVHRCLMEFCISEDTLVDEAELVIETSRHQYSDSYAQLAADFLLKL